MTHQISITARSIFTYMKVNGGVTIHELSQQLNETERRIAMAVGWLACEDWLTFTQRGRVNYITLK
jgi:hypothetical protein